jgi:hypothetical protein
MRCGCRSYPKTQVGTVGASVNAIQQIVYACTDAILDFPPYLREYVLHAIYAPYVTPDAVLHVAYVLTQCPEEEPGLKRKCLFVSSCLQQMGFSRQNLDEWMRTAKGF